MTATHHHLGRAIMLCLARARLTGMAAASQIGISQSGLVRLISGARRADPATLNTLSRATLWRDHPHAGQQIMIGHLMDELDRAGWRASDILMRARGNRQYAMRALHEIEEQTGVPATVILKELGLPANLPTDERLGRLRRRHGFEMHDVQEIVREHRERP